MVNYAFSVRKKAGEEINAERIKAYFDPGHWFWVITTS